MTTINLKKTSSDEILVTLYNYAEKIEKSSKGSVRMHFWGSESWDTDFDKDSGKLKVGVLAKDPQAALAMMLLVSFTSSEYKYDRDDIIDELMEISSKKDQLTVEEIIELLGDHSDSYRKSFDLNEIYKNEYYSKKVIDGKLKYTDEEVETTFQEVNVFNLARISENMEMKQECE